MKKSAKREPVKSVEVEGVSGGGETQSTGEDPGQMGSGGRAPGDMGNG